MRKDATFSEAGMPANRRALAQRHVLLGTTALFCAGLLTGCGVTDHAAPSAILGVAMHGSVHGGQQPVSGSTIQLYAVGTSGYGAAATPLLTSGVTTGAGGDFNITGGYTCPSASALVYITASRGNSGYTNNQNLAMMAALGACSQLNANTFIIINEVTTVGSVWALAPFMSGPTNVGSTSANAAGISNAFADVNTLVTIASGTSPGAAAPAGATVPTSEINTLADILAGCINSSGGTAGDPSTPCGKLFAAATSTSGTAPTDTITAAVNIAQKPAQNVSNLYSLVSATAPFQPTLGSQPNDFTIAVNFTGGNLSTPSALAADALGNVWIANSTGNTLTELSANGAVLSGAGYAGGLNAPSAIAVDASNYIWVTNQGNNTVSRFTANGTPVIGSPYSGGGLNAPTSIAFDSLGNGWIANSGGAFVTKTDSAGSSLTSYTPSYATHPLAIAVNPH